MVALHIYLCIAALVALYSTIFDHKGNGTVQDTLSDIVASMIGGLIWPLIIYNKLFGEANE